MCTFTAQALGVTGEHARLADVAQVQVEHHHALQPHAAPAVGHRAILERVDVRGDGLNLNAALQRALGQQLHVVDALGAADDLLAADEDVEAVGVLGVVGGRHGVERPGAQRVPVQDVEVRVVLRLDQSTQDALMLRGQVAIRVHPLHSVLLQHLDALGELEAQGGAQVLEGLEGVLLVHHLQLVREPLRQSVEHVQEEGVQHVQHLEVVLLDGHLHVQARELAQVAVRVAVLGAEHRADLEHALHVRHHRHLLVQLRGLRQARRLPHVVKLEHRRAALGRASDELGGVDLDEVLRAQRLAEQLAHAGLHAEDGLVGGGAQVDHAVVQARVLPHAHVRGVLGLEGALGARGVVDAERQPGHGAADAMDGHRLELHILLGARRDGLVGLEHQTLDVHHGLAGEVGHELYHALGHLDVVHEENYLDGGGLLAQHEECALALAAHVVHAPAQGDGLVHLAAVHVAHVRPHLARALLRTDEGRIAVAVRQRVRPAAAASSRADTSSALSAFCAAFSASLAAFFAAFFETPPSPTSSSSPPPPTSGSVGVSGVMCASPTGAVILK
eukprot:CAMPEP_0197580592 /NCGR_PEP_ID=MMETSP1326-20131121/4344_1 /TAXON_ID=1155430 /ORGANISM="Genus nov. species nov., Strain RCC2288" /LENGTH=559 /DNA_ID=CAMNT_0043144371 /DNA_START=127 /DNA_END=1808 /DNA_ORIENTATION=-